MKVDSKKLKRILDKLNKEFKSNNGYDFCRCYKCAFSVLSKETQCFSYADVDTLSEIIRKINSDYLRSADYRNYIGESGLACSHECIHYEDILEAVPFLFFEINKSHLEILTNLLQDNEFRSCFSMDLE